MTGALGWKVSDPHVVRDQLALPIETANPEPEPEPDIDDGLSWDEWVRALPPTP